MRLKRKNVMCFKSEEIIKSLSEIREIRKQRQLQNM